MRRVIYICNKFYQGRKDLGQMSSWEKNWHESINSYFDNVKTFHPDSFGIYDSYDSDQALLKLINSFQPDLIIMIYHIGLGWDREFISNEILKLINLKKIPLIAIWGDPQVKDQRKMIRKLQDYVQLNICTASFNASKRLGIKNSLLYTYVPVSRPRYQKKNCGNSCRISFAGSRKHRRAQYITKLQNEIGLVHSGGGEGKNALTREQYFQLLSHDITLSFGNSLRIDHLVNARTFEAISTGALLLEKWSLETARFLKPNIEYVPWYNKSDLLEKAKFLLENEEVRKKIAVAGHKKFIEFSNQRIWDSAKESLKFGKGFRSLSENNISDFKGISFVRLFMLRLVDNLARQRHFVVIFDFSYWIYRKSELLKIIINRIKMRLKKSH